MKFYKTKIPEPKKDYLLQQFGNKHNYTQLVYSYPFNKWHNAKGPAYIEYVDNKIFTRTYWFNNKVFPNARSFTHKEWRKYVKLLAFQ